MLRGLKVHGLVGGLVTTPGFSRGIAVTIQYPPRAVVRPGQSDRTAAILATVS